MQKTIKSCVCGKITAVVLAVLITLTCMLPLSQINEVSAANIFTSATKIYVNSSNYSDFAKSGISVVAKCYNASGTSLGEVSLTKESTGVYYFTAPTNTAAIDIIRKDTSIPTVSASVTGGCKRIYFNNTSNWSTVSAYAWYMDSSNNPVKVIGSWPGKAMTKVSNSSSYYYIDVPTQATSIIFNNSGGTQTEDITIDSSNNLYTFSSNQWSEYGVDSVISIDVTARASSSANTVYITGSTSYKWSKYATPISNMTTVYVKATSWSNAYVTYDPNDPLSVVTKCTYVDAEGNSSTSNTGYYKVQVPADAAFIFKPNSGTDNAGATTQLTVPSGYSKPCYNLRSKKWQEITDTTDEAVDYSVTSAFGDNILGVKATYYDYLSDAEYNGSWLNPIQAGTGFNGSSDNWYPFYIFNQKISAVAKNYSSTWKSPLYFGNFCNTGDSYPNGNDHNSNGWSNVTSSSNAYNFKYVPNNSNALASYNASVQGLVYSSLVNNKLMVTDSLQAPYFNNEWLMEQGIGKVISGEFPFRINDKGEYNEYTFNSADARDNVYFTWATSGSTTYPTKVNYAAGTNYGGTYYGIDDGIKYFMYNSSSGKGIFPFNNCSGTKGFKTNSNENLNYGFGIRMDIDFRVPTNGLIPGTSQPIEFTFEGDDDLWVYITDNETGKSELVLDMGGSHKMSEGSINFNTKTATVKEVYDEGGTSSETRYVYLSASNTGWSKCCAYFFNDSGTVGNSWPGATMTYTDGNYRIAIPSGATKVIFNNGNGNQTADIDLKTTSGAYWLGSDLSVNQWDITPSDAGLSSSSGGIKTNVKKSFTFDNTDDQKTYTMSVFYMERGLIESNMAISFTMTPLDNDLTVAKKVNTANVNAGLVDELTENEVFDYTVYDDNALATDKSYSLSTRSNPTTGNTGTFNLMDSQSALFNAQFDTGSSMKIVENTTSKSGLSYSTSWKLSDNNTGEYMKNGSSNTAVFDLINNSNNENLKTSLYLEYENTPNVAPIKVSKTVIDEDEKDISTDSNAVFNYSIALDLYEGNSYNSDLDLTYELYNSDNTLVGTYTAVDGAFSIKGGQYVIFKGIPIGTKYKITEYAKDGYNLYSATVDGLSASVSGNTILGTAGSGANSVVVTNMYKPVGATLTAYKTLGGENYTGTDFTFNVKGMASQTLNGVKTKNTSSVSYDVNTVTNGKVIFANTAVFSPFIYSEAGTYCYVISELAGNDTNYIYDTDTVYYAKVVVTSDTSGNLTVADPVYYSDSAFSKQINAVDVKFENSYANCQVVIYKTNYNNTIMIDGAEFKLIPAKKSGNKWVQDTSKQAYGPVAVDVAENGAVFDNIPQGDYLVVETKAPDGYELSTKEEYIKVERTSTNNGIVEFYFTDTETYSLPKAGGNGSSNTYVYAGVISIGLGFGFLAVKRKSKTVLKGCK